MEGPKKFYLFKVRLNCAGYDNEGQYWGIGLPLYHYSNADEDNSIIGRTRAKDRETAKADIIKWFPEAKFFR